MSETNQKEDKLITNTPTTPEGNDVVIPLKSFNGNQRFIVDSKCTGICCYCNFVIFVLEIILFIILFAEGIKIYINILTFIIIFSIQVFVTIMVKKKTISQIELIKNIQNNTFEIKFSNYCSKPFYSDIISLNNVYFQPVSYSTESEEGFSDTYGLIIVNTSINKSTIDLDKSEIKKPKKIAYLLDDVLRSNELYNFVGCKQKRNNQIFINVKEYMGINYEENFSEKKYKYNIDIYLKISENFFSFYLETHKINTCALVSTEICSVIISFIIISIIFSKKFDMYIKIIVLISFIIVFALINLLYVCHLINHRNKDIKRIDIVFSINFDKVFFGLVNYNEEEYLDTFLFDKISIGYFYDTHDKKLIVQFKDGKFQTIIKFNDKEPLSSIKGIIFILKKKFMNKDEKTTNNDNLLVKNWE